MKKFKSKKTILSFVICFVTISLLVVNFVVPTVKFYFEKKSIKNAVTTDVISLGNYHGSIKWKVLDVRDDKVLLVSKKFVDIKKFDKRNKGVTWENSYIRKWLNSDFYNKAFNNYEKRIILSSINKNQYIDFDDVMDMDKAKYIDLPDTKDLVFLLSKDEVKKYIDPGSLQITEMNNDETKYSWYTRTTAMNTSVVEEPILGFASFTLETGIRPAIWVDKSQF